MDSNITLSQLVFSLYVPLIIALVGFVVPVVTILLSIFEQAREEVKNIYQKEITKIAEDIKANELEKKQSTVMLLAKLFTKHYKLLLLNPGYCLLLLVLPPIVSVALSIAALNMYPFIFLSISAIFLILFLTFLCSLIKIIAVVTSLRDNNKDERERAVLETLQNILKNSDPRASKVKNAGLYINGLEIKDGNSLPSATLGKELSLKVNFNNPENDLPAKKIEVGLQFPLEVFDIKKQSGYSVYDKDNIIRFESEYLQKRTRLVFPTPLIIIPKRTGEYTVTAWLKGENVETRYFNLKIKVEMEV